MIDPISVITDSWNYLIVICLMMGGLFIVISQNNVAVPVLTHSCVSQHRTICSTCVCSCPSGRCAPPHASRHRH